MSFTQLLEAALAGTLRQDPPVVIAADDGSPESRMLRSASYEGLRRLAGRPLARSTTSDPIAPAAPETQPEVPRHAAERLPWILAIRTELAREWLRLVIDRSMRVPHVRLPDLLEFGRTEADDVQDLIVVAGGQRLLWLAKLNKDWQFADCSDPEARFVSAEREQRPRALRRLRAVNATRGRELLQQSWSAERGESRAQLLDALSIGLSAEDEPLLQAALGDSRKEVRETGLRLIRRIPCSAFGARWAARAGLMVTLETTPAEGARLVVREHVEPGPDWLADGIDPRPPRGTGMTAWLLQQVLALTPPSTWPLDLIEAVQHSEWRAPVLAGLGQAAQAFADDEWCIQLLQLRGNASTQGELLSLDVAGLFGTLQPAQAESLLRQFIELGPTAADGLWEARHDPWSEDFSRYLVIHLPRLIAKWHFAVAPLLRAAPSRLDPSVLSDVERLLDADVDLGWARLMVERMVEPLEYRAAMREELG